MSFFGISSCLIGLIRLIAHVEPNVTYHLISLTDHPSPINYAQVSAQEGEFKDRNDLYRHIVMIYDSYDLVYDSYDLFPKNFEHLLKVAKIG